MQAEVELIAARFEGETRFATRSVGQPSRQGSTRTTRRGPGRRGGPGYPAEPRRRALDELAIRARLLLLTYLAYSDELPFDELPQVLPRETDAVGTGLASVVAHAIRHLAFLTGQEPEEYVRALTPETLAHLSQLEPDVAGRFHRGRAA